MSTDDNDLLHRLEIIRSQQLQMIVKADPTLLVLKQVLERERVIHQMDGPALVTYVRDLEARYGHPDPAERDELA